MMNQLGHNDTKKTQEIIEFCEKKGFNVRIRDVAYAILKSFLNSDEIAYNVVFGVPEKQNEIKNYESLDTTKFLISYISQLFNAKKEKSEKDEIIKALTQRDTEAETQDSISFEENRAAMIELIDRTEKALSVGELETDKGLKIIADLRVKLNDKFKVSDKENEQYIIVQPKFNTICQYTQKECWLMTEEYAKEHFHLIKDPKYKSND